MQRHIPVLALCSLAGCLGSTHDMRSWADALHAVVFEVRVEQGDHARTAASAADLGALRALEAEHSDLVTTHFDRMRVQMTDMGEQCSHIHSGVGPDFTAMNAEIDAVLAEMQRHSTAIGAAPDLEAGEADETRHDGAMSELLGALQSSTEEMLAGAGYYRCSSD